MKKSFFKRFTTLLSTLVTAIALLTVFTFSTVSAENANVLVRTHVQNIGTSNYDVSNGNVAGTTGRALRLEKIFLCLTGCSGNIWISTHQANKGWSSYSFARAGRYCGSGTTNESRAIEAVKIDLSGEAAQKYDVWYRVHVQGYGWLGLAKNNEIAGTTGQSRRAEAIQVMVFKKGTSSSYVKQWFDARL